MEFQPETGTTDIGAVELSYLKWPGSGGTVIMLHATGFLPWLWLPVARRLGGEREVYAPYFCGHREADPHDGGLRWDLLARDLVQFVRREGIERPTVVGHSMGGAVAALATAAYGLDAAGLVLIEPIFLPEPVYGALRTVDDHPLASKSIRRRNHWESRAEASEYLRSKPLFADWDQEMLDLYLDYGMVSGDGGGLELACHPHREAAMFMGSASKNPWPLLPEIKCPVLILEGGKSENRHFIDLQKAASLIPRGEYRVVEGAGHLVPMERPQEAADILRGFLNGA